MHSVFGPGRTREVEDALIEVVLLCRSWAPPRRTTGRGSPGRRSSPATSSPRTPESPWWPRLPDWTLTASGFSHHSFCLKPRRDFQPERLSNIPTSRPSPLRSECWKIVSYFIFTFLNILKMLYSLPPFIKTKNKCLPETVPSPQWTIVTTEVESLLISQEKNLFNPRGKVVFSTEEEEMKAEYSHACLTTTFLLQRTRCSPALAWAWPRTPATGPSCRLRASPGDSPCSCSIRCPGWDWAGRARGMKYKLN